jgi:hypothetical protein
MVNEDGFLFDNEDGDVSEQSDDNFPYDCIFIYYNTDTGHPEIGIRGRFADTKETTLVLEYLTNRLRLTDYLSVKKLRGGGV